MRQTRHSSKYYYPRGFTLIEVMVVVVILGILATIVIPKLVSRPEQARMVKAKQDILGLQSALDLYRLDNRFYPSTDQGLTALVKEPSSEPKPPYWKQYLRKLPKDPWGNPYQYLNPGAHGELDIFSYGADGREGGEDSNAEIGNWNID